MVRYSLLRILIFFGCLGLLWLVGLRGPGQRPWLVIGAGLLSMVISYFVLAPFREQTVDKIAHRVEARTAARAGRVTDEDIEDAAIEDAPGAGSSGVDASGADASIARGRGTGATDGPAAHASAAESTDSRAGAEDMGREEYR
jgi:hypothetical protein